MRIVHTYKLSLIFIGVNLLVLIGILGYLFFQDAVESSLQEIWFHMLGEIGLLHFVHLLISLILFLTPFPATIVVLTNGYVLGLSGFFISYTAIIFASFLLYRVGFVSNEQGGYGFDLLGKYYRFFRRKIGDIGVTSGIFITRFMVPLFFHNYCLGAMRYRFDRFLVMILVAEVPITLFLTVGSSELSKLTFQEENFIGYFLSIALVVGSLLMVKIIGLYRKKY